MGFAMHRASGTDVLVYARKLLELVLQASKLPA